MPIIGGYIADAHIGMYNAIYGFSLIYLLGECSSSMIVIHPAFLTHGSLCIITLFTLFTPLFCCV